LLLVSGCGSNDTDGTDGEGVGQHFASSGDSGYSGEPHLHSGVYEDYPPVEGNDIPINFRNADGPLDTRGGLVRGEVYTALPY
jgi:murein DD-endopeptidase MepM/ murein hydrolase activator NlpD